MGLPPVEPERRVFVLPEMDAPGAVEFERRLDRRRTGKGAGDDQIFFVNGLARDVHRERARVGVPRHLSILSISRTSSGESRTSTRMPWSRVSASGWFHGRYGSQIGSMMRSRPTL